MSSFMHTLKIYHFKCKDKLIQIIIALLWSILSFNSFVATLFFLAIISILLSHSSYFNLFFPLISLGGTLLEKSTFRRFFRISPTSESSVIVAGICRNKLYIINVIIFVTIAFNELVYFYNYRWQIKDIHPYI